MKNFQLLLERKSNDEQQHFRVCSLYFFVYSTLHFFMDDSESHVTRAGTLDAHQYSHSSCAQGPLGQDLRNELGFRQKASCFGLTGRQVDCLGCLHNQQGVCHPSAVVLGHDMCLRTDRQLGRLRRSRQHVLYLQSPNERRLRQGGA